MGETALHYSRFLSFISRLFHPWVASQPGPTSADHFLSFASLVVKIFCVCGVGIERSCKYLTLAIASSNESKLLQQKPYRGLTSKEGNGRRSTHHTFSSQVILTSTSKQKSVQSGQFQCITDRGLRSGHSIKVLESGLLHIATRDITITKVPDHDNLESQESVLLPNRGACSS